WDPTYYILRGLSFIGLVRDLKEPPARVKTAARVREGAFDHGMFRAHWAKASVALENARALLREQVAEDGVAPTDPDAVSRREQLEEMIASNKSALQESISTALDHAEELGRLSYRRDRQAALTDGAGQTRAARGSNRSGPNGRGSGANRRARSTYSRPASSFSSAFSSDTLSAKLSSETRIVRARSNIDFSAVDRPRP